MHWVPVNSNVKKDKINTLRIKSFQYTESVICVAGIQQNRLPAMSCSFWGSSETGSVINWKVLAQRLIKSMTEILSLISLICSGDHEDLNFQTTIAKKRIGLLYDGLAVDSWIEEELLDFTSRERWDCVLYVSSVLNLKLQCTGHIRWL